MESSNAEQSSLSTRQSQRERVKKKVFSPSDQLQDLQMTHEEADKIIDVSISPVASGSSSQSIKNVSYPFYCFNLWIRLANHDQPARLHRLQKKAPSSHRLK